jgi:hypothetical protein
MFIGNFFSKLAIFLIKMYQVIISPLLGNNCRHYPSCSNYATEALKIHGFFRGLGLSLKRIARCHPWGTSGYDPVPPKNDHKQKNIF